MRKTVLGVPTTSAFWFRRSRDLSFWRSVAEELLNITGRRAFQEVTCEKKCSVDFIQSVTVFLGC